MAPVKTSKVTQNLSPKKSPKPQPVRIKRSDNNDKGSQKVSVAHPQKSSLKIAPQAAPVVVPCTGVYAVDIDNTVLTKLPLVSASVNTELLTNPRSAKDAVSKIMKSAENGRVLGFDMESKPRFVKGEAQQPPTVMQIATADTVYVFHLKRIASEWSHRGADYVFQQSLDIMRPILLSEGKDVYKCGVGLGDDLAILHHFAPDLNPRGFVCMHHFARKAGFKRPSLRVLTAILLGQHLTKSQQRSNWGRDVLNDSQVAYAAADAWASREVALKLQPLWLPVAKGSKSGKLELHSSSECGFPGHMSPAPCSFAPFRDCLEWVEAGHKCGWHGSIVYSFLCERLAVNLKTWCGYK